MGEIVGAGIISHVPSIMLSEEIRREMGKGKDTTLVAGMEKIRTEILDVLEADTLVIFDTHWHTTFEHVVDGREQYQGFLTSDELPRTICDFPYDYVGDPELACMIEEVAKEQSETWVHVSRSKGLPVHYGTVNLVHYLNKEEKILSVSTAQTGETKDFLAFGRILGEAIKRSNRKVALLASGGLSHRFFPLSVIREHEEYGLENVFTQEAKEMDEKVLSLLQEGKHAEVIELMPEYRKHAPEGRFGHYLMMIAALGGEACTAPGFKCSEYEGSVGTGQVHMWFNQPKDGWV